MQTPEQLASRLKGGVFISSMMGVTNGEYVARHGEGACMVQIGALVADAIDRSHDPDYLLPLDQADMVPILAKEVAPVRQALGDTPIALNAAPGDLESAIRMAKAFHEAGGDIFELNCHGGYGKLLERGLLRAMVLPENRPTMIEWLKELCRLAIPIVVKFNASTEGVDFVEALTQIRHIDGLFGVHFNVRSKGTKEPDLAFVQQVRPHVAGVLHCSGHVTDRAQFDALARAGADCIGISQGLLDDETIVQKIAGGE